MVTVRGKEIMIGDHVGDATGMKRGCGNHRELVTDFLGIVMNYYTPTTLLGCRIF